MKLMVVIPYFFPYPGGMEKHVYMIIKGLKEKYGWDIIVVTSNDKENKNDILYESGFKIYKLKKWFKISNTPFNPLWYFEIKKIIKKEKPDIINGRAPVPYMSDLAALLSGETPFVLGYHFPSMRKGNFFLDIPILIYENLFFPIILKKSSKIICASDYVRDVFLARYKHKSITITQGIDKNTFKPMKTKKTSDILFVGNFKTEVKGLKYLLEAVAILKRDLPKIKLSIVGIGEFYKYLELCNNLQISQNVEFKGEMESVRLAKEYNSTDIFVLPSITDNLPTVILEAMACKKPIIATNVGAVGSIIKNRENGLLVPPRNSIILAEKIKELIENPKLARQIAARGFKKIQKNYEWSVSIKKTHDTLIKILK